MGGKLTSPVIAEGKVFVAAVDSIRFMRWTQQTGRRQWQFTAGRRVDSPPTIWQGRVLFGSRDGFVYCLRASDGVLRGGIRAGRWRSS